VDPGSLTQRLRKLSGGDFRVQVIEEGWHMPKIGERALFTGNTARQLMWSRSVLLLGMGEPWVAAHSLIPVSSLRGSLRQMIKLRDRPLGGFLFKHPGLRRLNPQITRLADHWGRRSVFILDGRPLLVAEFFLPALLRWQDQSET